MKFTLDPVIQSSHEWKTIEQRSLFLVFKIYVNPIGTRRISSRTVELLEIICSNVDENVLGRHGFI